VVLPCVGGIDGSSSLTNSNFFNLK
jgi:hypothetical protein